VNGLSRLTHSPGGVTWPAHTTDYRLCDL